MPKLTNSTKIALAIFLALAIAMWLLPKLTFVLILAAIVTGLAWTAWKNKDNLFPKKPPNPS